MGKRKYNKADVCPQKTDAIALPGLLALDAGGEKDGYYAVHQRYFSNEKSVCPACGSNKTRSSKVIHRKLKDIVWKEDGNFEIITIHFYQRYLRCDGCKDSVFPEETVFVEKGCNYTNRLADTLADGTLRQSYNRVCKHYGVPASTASVGDIMRRRIKYKESHLPPIRTPRVLGIVEVPFYATVCPVVLAVESEAIYCIDILPGNSEKAYISFLKTLDAEHIDLLYIDPGESLRSALDTCLPEAQLVITHECIERCARNALLEVIRKDGKRFPITKKNDKLVLLEEHINDSVTKAKIREGFRSRPRLKYAYKMYQQLLTILNREWTYEQLLAWGEGLTDELPEFDDLRDLIELHEEEIRTIHFANKPPEKYAAAITGVCRAIGEMPNCIFDVLRARCMLTVPPDIENRDDEVARLGIETSRFVANANEIAASIRRIKDPYSDY